MREASKADVQTAFSGARMARREITNEAIAGQREHLRAVIQSLVAEAKTLFENCPADDDGTCRWSPIQARMGLMRHLQPMVMRAAASIEHGLGDHTVQLRRRAFLAGVHSVSAALGRMGVEPKTADDIAGVVSNAPTEIRLNGATIEVMDLVQWADRRLREAVPLSPHGLTEASVVTVGGDQVELADDAFYVEGEPPEPRRDDRRCSARVIVLEGEDVWLFDPKDEPYVMLPGGGAEEGERLAAAAIRETIEETGLVVKLVRYVADFSDQFSQRRYYVGERIGGEPTKVDQDGDRPVRVYLKSIDEAKGLLTSEFDVLALAQATKQATST